MSKIDPQRMYKFGKTTSEDVLERFNEAKHYELGWRAIPLSKDYNIKPLWSHWVTKEEAILAETWFKREFPKGFYSETDYNGITECRNWDYNQSTDFFNILSEKFPKTPEYWEEISKLKEAVTLHKTHEKIYYIMLTKKQ